jgi:hypothetical protein
MNPEAKPLPRKREDRKMMSKRYLAMSLAALVAVLGVATLSTTAEAGDLGLGVKFGPCHTPAEFGPYEAPYFGPYDPVKPKSGDRGLVLKPYSPPLFRPDVGKPGQKPGDLRDRGAQTAKNRGKFGPVFWRIKLEHPFWTPILDIFQRLRVGG